MGGTEDGEKEPDKSSFRLFVMVGRTCRFLFREIFFFVNIFFYFSGNISTILSFRKKNYLGQISS